MTVLGQLLCLLAISACSLSAKAPSQSCKNYLLYCAHTQQIKKAVALYQQLPPFEQEDLELIEQMAYIWIQQGLESKTRSANLLSLYALQLSHSKQSLHLYQKGVQHPDPYVQLATIGILKILPDDAATRLLLDSLTSYQLPIAIAAAYALAVRQAVEAVGPIEALMHKLPPTYRTPFPRLFGLIGSKRAHQILRRLIDDRCQAVRLCAVLTTIEFGLDQFLDVIKNGITHASVVEKELYCTAIGHFEDRSALDLLTAEMHQKRSPELVLAAAKALGALGESEKYRATVYHLAKQHNLFAIALLGNSCDDLQLLKQLQHDEQTSVNVKLNATLRLLEHRDVACLDPLIALLIDDQDLYLAPIYSPGKSLQAWQLSSVTKPTLAIKQELAAAHTTFTEHLLTQALELPMANFMQIAQVLLSKRVRSLFPLLTQLLANIGAEGRNLLRAASQTCGEPFMRAHAHLALYRDSRDPIHLESLLTFLRLSNDADPLSFQPLLAYNDHRQAVVPSHTELTPQYHLNLVLAIFELICQEEGLKGVSTILEMIADGPPQNRHLLAGFLLKAIE